MLKILMAIMLLCTSCASMSGDWGPWKITDVSTDKQVWRFCSLDLDGPELARKGFCYISQECRFRKTIFGNEKSECRQAPLFCAWSDMECVDRYGILNKVIVNKEKIR